MGNSKKTTEMLDEMPFKGTQKKTDQIKRNERHYSGEVRMQIPRVMRPVTSARSAAASACSRSASVPHGRFGTDPNGDVSDVGFLAVRWFGRA